MDRSPLYDAFRRGETPREIRMEAALGAIALPGPEQLELLVLLTGDIDPEIAAAAERTIASVSAPSLASVLGTADVSAETKALFAARGVTPDEGGGSDVPLFGADVESGPENEPQESALQRIANLNVAKRIALAMKGTREERAILIRDPNRIVTTAVLSSPKMTDTEIAGIAKMANVSEDVLRVIAMNRAWLKNYSVALGLAKNPKTPIALSMNLLSRLTEKDLKLISTDRNVPDVLRTTARKKIVIDR